MKLPPSRSPYRRPASRVPARGARLHIETLEGREVPATFTVTNLADGTGIGSLRDAITAANAAANVGGPDTIDFTVAGPITLASSLPDVTDAVVIDGSTAPGFNATTKAPIVEVNGATAFNTFRFAAGSAGSRIQFLSITGSSSNGITLDAGNVTVLGNYIGLKADGTTSAGNRRNGILVNAASAGNVIGTAAAKNVIGANTDAGINLSGSTGNVVAGNFVGTNATGLAARANGGGGLFLDGASNNQIGGFTTPPSNVGKTPNLFSGDRPPDGNLISGNAADGVLIQGGGSNTLAGNFIGTDATGIAPLGNALNGVNIQNSNGNVLAGTTATQDPFIYFNVVSGNGQNGLLVNNSNGTVVQANFFGLGSDDKTGVGNGGNGVVFQGTSSNTTFGGPIPLGNVVAANVGNGVVVSGTGGNFVASNNFTGVAAFQPITTLGNKGDGWNITATGGNIVLQVGNIISGNGGDGIEVGGAATGVQIVQNIIGLNTDGQSLIPNLGDGIKITGTASNVVVGGTAVPGSIVPVQTISGNGGWGVNVNTTGANVQVNFSHIGTTSGGIAAGAPTALGNGLGGIQLSGTSGVAIGSTDPAKPTVVSGNKDIGIFMVGTTGARVVNTLIGIGRDGSAVGNAFDGVAIRVSSNITIGGVAPMTGNAIANNGGNGVTIGGSPAAVTTVGIEVTGNAIFANARIGIDLGNDGVTANGANPRAFPNNGQNKPVFTAATNNFSSVVVAGTFASRPSRAYRVEYFATPAGGGVQRFLGAQTVTTDGAGNATLAAGFPLPADVGEGSAVTATATDLTTFDTSEFALTAALTTAPLLTAYGEGAGGAGLVNVYNQDGSFRFTLQPYGLFGGGVTVATGDVNGDDVDDIVAGAGPGGGPRVVVLDGVTGAVRTTFFAYEPTFGGGITVAAGAVTGDARADVLTGPGAGGGPRVRVFDPSKGYAAVADFYALEPTFGGGITVAVGEATGDSREDIVVGAGPGGGPRVVVFDGLTFQAVATFYAFAPSFAGGVYVTANNGLIGVGAGAGGGPLVSLFAQGPAGYTPVTNLFAFDSSFTGGVRVNIEGGAKPLLYVGAGPGPLGPRVRAFDLSTRILMKDFFAFDRSFPGGVFVG